MAQTAATRHQDCDSVIDYTPATAVTGGEVVVVGTLVLVATEDIAANEKGALAAEGIFKVPKVAAQAGSAGDAIYWDVDGSPVTGTALSGAASTSSAVGNLMGWLAYAAASGEEYYFVVLNPSKRTATIAGSVTADDLTGSDSNLGILGKAGSAGGAGGQITSAGGVGDTNGAGGAVSYNGGAGAGTGAGGAATYGGGASGAGATGNGGAVTSSGGAALSTNGNGGAATYGGGVATGTGTGGATTLTSGASAGASGTAGALSIDNGAATGGTAGALSIGTNNAASITIGQASVATRITGPLTRTPGASTAAAGSTTADAGVLPAGTAGSYPVTGADDTKGVRIHASDKMTGREIKIGNLVSNKILKVYAPSGGAINGAAGDVAFSSVSGKGVILQCLDSVGNTWMAW